MTSAPLQQTGPSPKSGVGQYLRTMSHLRAGQIVNLVNFKLRKHLAPSIQVSHAALAPFRLGPSLSRPRSYLGAGDFRFLQKTASLGWPIQWEAREQSALWRYNLHYFDYLLQPGLDYATGMELMKSWRQANPLGSGPGWDPYPISLRLVNWIKFAHQHGDLPADLVASLAQQTAYLAQRVEHHLSGNHLLTNGKGLWFGGAALGEAAWEKSGRDIVLRELQEQILPDGGHYELSPMYHSIVLEDLLDLINLEQARGREVPPVLAQAAGRARAWLAEMADERGRIPLLNDAAHGIAAEPEQLVQYADSLGVTPDGGGIKRGEINGWQWRDLSGYYLLTSPPWRVLFNAAPMGPDHQPGHAHCDMLSILLQYGGQDILCDTGVFEYQEGERREFCRSTAAHNTVVLDGLEQSEVWKAFRLGRRGQIQGPWLRHDCLAAGHNGFAQQCKGLGHTRRVVPLEDGMVIADHLRGPGRHSFKAYYHFAPEVELAPYHQGWLVNRQLLLWPKGAEARLGQSEYYPRFGESRERPCLVLEGGFQEKTEFYLLCTSYS